MATATASGFVNLSNLAPSIEKMSPTAHGVAIAANQSGEFVQIGASDEPFVKQPRMMRAAPAACPILLKRGRWRGKRLAQRKPRTTASTTSRMLSISCTQSSSTSRPKTRPT
eukprot:6208940-Pleurochrysis_carterae.AAC.3